MEYHYEERFLIGYGEVDEHNRMRISSLLNFLQDVATMHSKSIGYGTTECMNRKIGWFLISWQIKMYSYPQGDTMIKVRTWSRKFKGCHAFRAFEVIDENENLVARVDSMWALVNLENGRPIRIYDDMTDKYGQIDKCFFEEEKVKIDVTDETSDEIKLKIQRRDIDTNGHCNNTKYIDFVIEAIPQNIYDNKAISEFEIIYKKAVALGEEITVGFNKQYEDEFINIIKKENGEIATIIKTKWE